MNRSRLVWVGVMVTACAGTAIPTTVGPPPAPPATPATSPATVISAPSSTTPATTTTTLPGSTTTPTTPTTTPTTTTTLPPGVTPPPDWLGTRILPVDRAGRPEAPDSPPPEMVDRRFTTEDLLPPPVSASFSALVGPVPAEVAERSTWHPLCPVELEDLSYIVMTFWGFDDRPHTGEMILNSEVVGAVVGVFEQLYDARYPMEQMRVTSPGDLEAPPTGDGNVTESFVCRPVTGGSGWSQHAYGLAIDINPFHNPYLRGDVLIPELAGAYLDRDRVLPGVITEGDVVTQAFDAIGWGWGGRWTTLDDWQHFSRSGR